MKRKIIFESFIDFSSISIKEFSSAFVSWAVNPTSQKFHGNSPTNFSVSSDLRRIRSEKGTGQNKGENCLVGGFNPIKKKKYIYIYSQIGSFPQMWVKIKNIWNHPLDLFEGSLVGTLPFTLGEGGPRGRLRWIFASRFIQQSCG